MENVCVCVCLCVALSCAHARAYDIFHLPHGRRRRNRTRRSIEDEVDDDATLFSSMRRNPGARVPLLQSARGWFGGREPLTASASAAAAAATLLHSVLDIFHLVFASTTSVRWLPLLHWLPNLYTQRTRR